MFVSEFQCPFWVKYRSLQCLFPGHLWRRLAVGYASYKKLAAKEVGSGELRVKFKIYPNTWKEESCHHLATQKTHLFQSLRLILILVVVCICSVQIVFYQVTDTCLSIVL